MSKRYHHITRRYNHKTNEELMREAWDWEFKPIVLTAEMAVLVTIKDLTSWPYKLELGKASKT